MAKSIDTSKQASMDVPIFLRKTYHMIDSCDPQIASWSQDGKTFVVKEPSQFERAIIPQFFKHNKFTSFVRQLNFYQFRKIKYIDSIRIDPKLEAETANYWRFRHEYFQRGRPDLLSEIKRLNGTKGTASSLDTGTADKGVKSEVQSLKQRIEEMTKNIDQLTAMVNQVSIKQGQTNLDDHVGGKRKKRDPCNSHFTPTAQNDARPDEMFSSMDLEADLAILPGVASLPVPDGAISAPPSAGLARESSTSSHSTDTEFVDDLFSAFAEDSLPELEPNNGDSRQPDPELMKRLGDALVLLPHDTQVLIVDRLVAAIVGSEITGAATASDPIPLSPEKKDVSSPLAAATLAALLHHYSVQVQGKNPKNVASKAIPVIPVHA